MVHLPWGQVEVRRKPHASTQFPHYACLRLHLLSISMTESATLVARETGFFSMRCQNTWGGQAGFVSPCDEGFTPCMFNRQTYGPRTNTRAHLQQPDYVQWSFWHLRLASFIMRGSSHSGHLCYCCWWVQLRPQSARSNKEATHVSLTENTITSHTWTLSVGYHTFCPFFASQHPPTHRCLP